MRRSSKGLGAAVAAATLAIPLVGGSASAAGGIAAPGSVDFGSARFGVDLYFAPIIVTNEGSTSTMLSASGLSVSGADPDAFFPITDSTGTSAALQAEAMQVQARQAGAERSAAGGSTTVSDCFGPSGATSIPAGGSCELLVVFIPTGFGTETAGLTITATNGSSAVVALTGIGTGGYYLAGAKGETAGFGDAAVGATDPREKVMPSPVVGVAATLDGNGTWAVGANGAVYPSGDAPFDGDLVGTALDRPVVGIAGDPQVATTSASATDSTSATLAEGYWMVASDGGVFSYGGAAYYGSEGGTRLNAPIVGMAATPDGLGYWLVAADGGVFSFGDAAYYGSTGGLHLNAPIVGMAATPDGKGYWLVAADGGIFSFGDAGYHGSEGGTALREPIRGMAATPDGAGYWLVGADGGVFTLGDAAFFGSLPGVVDGIWTSAATDAVGIATTNQPLLTGLDSVATDATGSRVLPDVAGRGRVTVLPAVR